MKPDVKQRGLTNEIERRVKAAGFGFRNFMGFVPSREFLEALYVEHKGKSFYDGTLEFMGSDHNYLYQVSKEYDNENGDIIKDFRGLVGKTFWRDAGSGTVRGDLGRDEGDGRTLMHTPDSIKARDEEATLIDTLALPHPVLLDWVYDRGNRPLF